jgi:Ca2+-dependent lipid-binding protein
MSTTLTFHINLLQGRNLAVKDRHSSDPFVRFYANDAANDDDYLFQSRSKSETLNPKFNETFEYTLQGSQADHVTQGGTVNLILRLFDDDGMHGEDPLGTVHLPLKLDMSSSAQWYPVEKGEGEYVCANASGELNVKVTVV